MRSSAGSGAAGGDVGREEGGEVAGGGVGGVLDRAVAAGLVHGDHGVRPGEEVGRGLLRDAEEAGDDADRQWLGEGGDEVEPVAEGRRPARRRWRRCRGRGRRCGGR